MSLLELDQEKKESKREYFRKYREENRERLTQYQHDYWEKNKKDCIYFLMNDDGEIFYFGSTCQLGYRVSLHVNGYSNLNLTEELWDKLKLSHFQYSYVKVNNKAERLYMEYYLINKYKPKLNQIVTLYENYNAGYNDRKEVITEGRKAELEKMADSLVYQLYI